MASSVNLGVARDCDVAVVLVPAGVATPSPFGAGPAAEIAAFAGAVFGVFADDDSLAAFGPNPLDPRCRVARRRPDARRAAAKRRRSRGSWCLRLGLALEASRACMASSRPTAITSSAR